MLIIAPELVPLCRFLRTAIVIALGGEPKKWHSDEELEEYITSVDKRIVPLLHDLIVMLDYLYALKQANEALDTQERDVLEGAYSLVIEIKAIAA